MHQGKAIPNVLVERERERGPDSYKPYKERRGPGFGLQ